MLGALISSEAHESQGHSWAVVLHVTEIHAWDYSSGFGISELYSITGWSSVLGALEDKTSTLRTGQ